MNKLFFFITGLLLCLAYNGEAQKSEKDSSRTMKNELLIESITNSSLVRANPVSGIMYRRNFNKVSLRIRFNGNYGQTTIGVNGYSNQHYSISYSLGIQKNVPVTKNFQLYWGADLMNVYQYNHSSDTSYNTVVSSNSIGLSPFVGLKFTFKKRFIIGAENSGFFSYKNSLNQKEFTSFPLNNRKYHSESFDFTPSSTARFYIGFNF